MIFCSNLLCGLDHIFFCMDLHTRQHFCLRNIRSQHGCNRKQTLFQCINCFITDQFCSTGSYHNRIYYDVLCFIFFQLICNLIDQCIRRYHTNLHCIRINIGKYIIHLIFQKFWRYFHNTCDSGCILCSQSCDRTHSVYAIADHCLNICLNSGASTGITSSDC